MIKNKEKRIKELLNRKPSRWGNVSIKTFEQDITLLTTAFKDQRKENEKLRRELNELKQQLRDEGK